jgi:hypothetical protein
MYMYINVEVIFELEHTDKFVAIKKPLFFIYSIEELAHNKFTSDYYITIQTEMNSNIFSLSLSYSSN